MNQDIDSEFLHSPPFFPKILRPSQMWRSLSFWVNVAFLLIILRAVPKIIVDYWFLKHLGQQNVFWTNFTIHVILFAVSLLLFTFVIYLPFRAFATTPIFRRAGFQIGLWVGIFAGWLLTLSYQKYLLALKAVSFGEKDPVFGNDISFYAFTLPAIRISLTFLTVLVAIGAAAAIFARNHQLRSQGIFQRGEIRPLQKIGLMITNILNLYLLIFGLSLTARTFLSRYGLLFKNNEASGVRMGAEYLDIRGFFSILNMIHVSVLLELGILVTVGITLFFLMKAARKTAQPVGSDEGDLPKWRFSLRVPGRIVLGLLAVDLAFFLGVVLKNHLIVAPNEPTIQIPYIERHISATLKGYRLDNIKTVEWKPPQEPIPAESLLTSKSVQNAPILPTWVSYLEEPPDIQHFERVQAAGTTMVYGPVLELYEQEQQLRPYYKFISVDGVRYTIDGEKRMYASAVRELPSRGLRGPKAWLRHWGSAALMYTHGLGLVMSPVNQVNQEGGPVYILHSVPPETSLSQFETESRIYFGEGTKDDYILTDIRYLKEFDHATDQFRKENVYSPEVESGIPVNSFFKRLIFALDTMDIPEFLFTDFIDHDRTRVHIYRTPMQRIKRITPFLFLDTNPYAFIADKKILWMVNALTTTKHYPYAFREVFGDKADERAVEKYPERIINYAEDSVKICVDAYTGEVHFYKIAEDPIIDTWDRIYPGLFEPISVMPESVRAQLTYPLQWFHIQFDDIYKRYHQQHPIEFYNVEDLWDDADEVLGSLGAGLTEFGTGDQMTFSYEGYNILVDPADLPPGTDIGEPGELQFVMMMPYTPEGARNLRSLVIALQDPGNYGKLLNLRVPQGTFIGGPEQADTSIDNDAQVNQQITLWVRHGSEVVRGHTILVPVAGDLLYIEPLWIVSLQNRLPQIKLFSVVYRGRTTMSVDLEEAIRLFEISEAEEQKANELPWFNELPPQVRQKAKRPSEGRQQLPKRR
ncbi:MAG: UPF0182 family protein [Candidatus Aminicenantes bacterium]|nr:MAG: UPF0182 family protein [Candidatus Aminicenantes bacterium]